MASFVLALFLWLVTAVPGAKDSNCNAIIDGISGKSLLQFEKVLSSPAPPAASAPSVVFHIFGYANETPPWAEGEEVNVFAPEQDFPQGRHCEKYAKPLHWSRQWEPPAWWAAQRQYLPSLESLLEKHPDGDYYFLADADTLVFPRNLHTLVAYLEDEVLDKDDDLYMGHGLWFHPFNADFLSPFIMSGGGVLVRGRTLRLLNSTGSLHACATAALSLQCWHHCDWTLASCMARIGVKATGHTGFQQFVDKCPGCCTDDSIACHPVRDMKAQVSMLETQLSRQGPAQVKPLTKHLAESCGKNYAWEGSTGSFCLHSGHRFFKQYALGDENLCISGHIVPELFVIGAQKSGTTTLAYQLMAVPGIIGRRLTPGATQDAVMTWKEAHTFTQDLNGSDQLQAWLQGYPTCTHETRIVTMDATPNYLFHPNTPQRLQQQYGSASSRLTFAVVLREPLSRMQSAFYHYQASAREWGTQHAEVFEQSFKQYVEQLMRSNGTHHELLQPADDPFFNSRYADQLENYFSTFDSHQFMISPFSLLRESGSFARHIAERLRLPHLAETFGREFTNHHNHPLLEAEFSESTPALPEVHAFVEHSAGAKSVADILVKDSGKGADLFAFDGDRHSADFIATWLAKSW
eukprot:TRINITY_DN92338_c0_g1_i1.p1 TRINITY_DN92338_c0_g1~~TRINITY_DN92338_c0_g1_i1.p1  ORF type:complete len:634 (+),score=81.76 TRINITY_DN92338_c0_g1_i1:91-1992(+)